MRVLWSSCLTWKWPKPTWRGWLETALARTAGGGFPSWAGLNVCEGQCRRPFLSPEVVFLGEAGTTRGQPARGHVSEHCSCLRDSVWLWALQSECRLDGSCARSSLAQPRPAQRQVLRPHRVQAPGPGGRALGEGVMRTSDLTGGSSLWDWMGSM